MKMSMAELADKFTILLIKIEHGVKVQEDMLECKEAIECVDYSTLYRVNLMIWQVEEMISKEQSLKMVGVFCLALRNLNARRIAEKNRIAKKHGGSMELKQY